MNAIKRLVRQRKDGRIPDYLDIDFMNERLLFPGFNVDIHLIHEDPKRLEDYQVLQRQTCHSFLLRLHFPANSRHVNVIFRPLPMGPSEKEPST
jgi:hypothetical protein